MDVPFFVLSALVLFCTTISSQRCLPTFQNHLVTIEYDNTKRTATVSKCLSGNYLPKIDVDHFVIHISGQVIPALRRGAISNIEQSFELKIVHNKIEAIEAGAFENLSGLEELSLDHNHLVTLKPYAFENLPSLRWILLQNNNIEVIPKDTFVYLPSLKAVYLNYNNLKKFNQNWFASTPMLQRIVLSNNQIEYLSAAAFQDIQTLEELSFANNKLKYIHPEAFYGLSILNEINLSGNQLTSFDVKLSYLSAIYRLGMSGNKFTYLSPREFNPILPTVKEIFVHANPLQCSCADSLVIWASNNNIKLFWKCENNDIYCITPLDYDTECAKRPENNFNSTILQKFQNFESDCVIQ